MKKLIGILLLTFLLSVPALAGPYSVGWRAGYLAKFSVKGAWNKTGEGYMLLGNMSSAYVKTDSQGNKTVINPWYFSADKRAADTLMSLAGQMVWVKYEQYKTIIRGYDTEYMIVEVGPITAPPKPLELFAAKKPDGKFSQGVRAGRVVKLSVKGWMWKTGEMQLQVGQSGNIFKHMSINEDNTDVFDYVVACLKAQVPVRLHYVQAGGLGSLFKKTETSYNVYGLQQLR